MPPASVTTKKAAPIKGAKINKKNRAWALDWGLAPASKYIVAIAEPSFTGAVCSHLLGAVSAPLNYGTGLAPSPRGFFAPVIYSHIKGKLWPWY
jgi:hypothetical protein